MKRRSPERATEGRTPLSEADMDNGSAGVEFREMQSLRKELEECRRAVQKSADEMQAFAYSVSHDLQTPSCWLKMNVFAESRFNSCSNCATPG